MLSATRKRSGSISRIRTGIRSPIATASSGRSISRSTSSERWISPSTASLIRANAPKGDKVDMVAGTTWPTPNSATASSQGSGAACRIDSVNEAAPPSALTTRTGTSSPGWYCCAGAAFCSHDVSTRGTTPGTPSTSMKTLLAEMRLIRPVRMSPSPMPAEEASGASAAAGSATITRLR